MIGITVLPEYLQSESIDGVLNNVIDRAGATVVATSPYVMELTDENTGVREPPADAGAGSVRLLDRPLWGKRELWCRTAPSFEPNRSLYEGLRYQPPEPTELTSRAGHILHDFIDAAHGRGLKVWFQVQAAIPPGYRVQFGGPQEDDAPRLPDGRIPARRVANNASLASSHIHAYQYALIRDLLGAYPDIDGIRFDWPEYPPYLLDSAFLDFSDHARQAALRLGLDFDRMRADAGALYAKLHGGLTDDDLRAVIASDRTGDPARWFVDDYPGIADMLELKAQLSEELLTGFRQVMNEAGGGNVELAPSAFPPPWNAISGMDYGRNAKHCGSISVKLYGMHWAMMLRFYGDQLRAANPGLSDSLLVKALVKTLNIADDEGLPSLNGYHYPEPHEAHPVGRQVQIDKIGQALSAAGDTPIHVLAHGYGPLEDFQRRIRIAREAAPHGVWVNRYAYLSNDKLDAIGAAFA